jgi:hypothetical protein
VIVGVLFEVRDWTAKDAGWIVGESCEVEVRSGAELEACFPLLWRVEYGWG